ncbi:hypothetical protein BMS3Abin17_00026 [archaeon BMS3Abin17]|nr:hypothetical protein BMS3Abin17_00026 [archaeon BMS3Abin17]
MNEKYRIRVSVRKNVMLKGGLEDSVNSVKLPEHPEMGSIITDYIDATRKLSKIIDKDITVNIEVGEYDSQ